MTPKEAAALANDSLNSPDDKNVHSFLCSESPRNIQLFIHLLRPIGHERFFHFASNALAIRLAEDAEKMNRRLVFLTWAIVILTAALLFFTIILYQDARTQAQRTQAASPNNIKSP
jgi:hypothetical protein